MNISSQRLALLLISSVICGCTGQPVKISSVVDRNAVDLTRGRPIHSQAGGFQLFTFIPINVNSRQQRAYEELQQIAAGDAIADVNVTESWTYAFAGTIFWTEMNAVAYPKLRPAVKSPVGNDSQK